jgi:hypothetical protein
MVNGDWFEVVAGVTVTFALDDWALYQASPATVAVTMHVPDVDADTPHSPPISPPSSSN